MPLDRSQRTAHVTVALLVLGSLAAVPLLVPTSAELGTHLLQDHQGTLARTELERALAERGAVPDVALPLAKLLIEQSEPSAALRLLARLGPARLGTPAHDLRLLALRQAGRVHEVAAELERLADDRPDVQALTELSGLYASLQLREAQAATLDRLLALAPDQPEVLRTAAHLHAETGERHKALDLLDDLARRWPAELQAPDLDLLLGLRLELDPSPAALELVESHLPEFRADRVELAWRFLRAGRLQEAGQLLDRQVAAGSDDPRTLEAWTHAQVALGRLDKATATLRERLAGQGLGRVTSLLCRVTLDQGDGPAALELARETGWHDLEPAVRFWLARTAAALGALDDLRDLLAGLQPDVLAQDPVAAVHLHKVAGLRDQALHWADRAREATLAPQQRLWLAELLLDLGRLHDAAETLDRLEPEVAEPLHLALLWWRTGAPARGLAALERTRARPQALRAGRALLLAASGRVDEALALLPAIHLMNIHHEGQGTARPPVRDWLQALVQVAAAQKRPELAVFGYRHLIAHRPGQRGLHVALVGAWLELGQPIEALAAFRALHEPLLPAEKPLYRQVLLAAHRAQAPVRDELVRSIVAHLEATVLADPTLRDQEAQSWLHVLLELGARLEAKPYVARLARSQGGAWAARQVELLRELGASTELAAWWRERGLDPQRPVPERLDAARQLLAAGDRDGALEILRSLADGEGPDSDVVRLLVHVWGPRPGPAAVEWLAARARKSSGDEHLAWLRHLLWVGAPEAVVALVPADPQGPLLEVAVDAWIAARQWLPLAQWTERRAGDLTNIKLLARLAGTCAAHGHPRAAAVAYARLYDLGAADATALRYLAQIEKGSKALRYWQAFFALPADRGDTWRDRVAYGELLLADPVRRDDGRLQFDLALRMLATAPLPEAERARHAGRLHARLGRHAEAIPLLEKALLSAPCDHALRADLVAELLATDQHDRAAAVVDPPASCNGRP